jgi:predicted glycosyltransferase
LLLKYTLKLKRISLIQFKKKVNVENLDIITIRDCDPLLINYYSDYVIGMHSNMIIESFLLGEKILRVQTGQLFDDLLKFYP